jgi:peptidoglycan hydrolase FlgJ
MSQHHTTHRHHPTHRSPSHVETFIARHLADAKQVSTKSGVPASVILAQSGLESGWGLRVSGNAYFGVKGHAPDGSSRSFVTHEVTHGVAQKITDTFRDYRSYAEAAEDYANMLRRRFPMALAHKDDSLKFVTFLRCYATDPLYVQKLQTVIRFHNLQQYDAKKP